MEIKELYNSDEEITVESYLNKHGIENIEEYLHPSGKYLDNCLLYENMKEAVQAFKWHYLHNDSTYILCDSGDTDGITSTCIMYKYMKKLNPKWNIKILLHKNKERGLGDEVLFNQIYKEPRPLLIIPDSGTNDKEQVKILTEEKDITVIVLDHHSLNTPIEQGILVNNQIGNIDHCGSGCVVTHKFLQALDLEFDKRYSKEFIDLVALSIISDSMDITSLQNRTYLYFGIFKPNILIKNNFLRTLINKFTFTNNLTIRDLVFKIIPKLNAICRCGEQDIKQRMILAFLDMDNIEEVAEICKEYHIKQAEYVNNFIIENKNKIDDSNNIIIYSGQIKPSFNGLIAGKFTDIFNKPCVVGVEKDNAIMGSLRSPVDIYDYINESGLAVLQGHHKACGTIIPKENINALYDLINTLDFSCLTNEIEVLKSYYTSEIPKNMFNMFNELNLWDTKFLPKPLFHIKGIEIKGKDIAIMKEKHLKFKYKDVEFIYFNANKELREKLLNKKNLNLEVIGALSINEWKGKKTNQVIIQDLEIQENKEKGMEEIF